MKVADMIARMHEPIPAGFLKTKKDPSPITYCPWYFAAVLADERTGGMWSHELMDHWIDEVPRGNQDKGYAATPLAHVRVRVTIHGSDRDISREAVGVDDEPNGQRGTPLERAEAAGLRRALAKFGLGLALYDKDRRDKSAQTTQQPTRFQKDQVRRGAPAAPAAATNGVAPPRQAQLPAAAPAADAPPDTLPEHWPTTRTPEELAAMEAQDSQVDDFLAAFDGASSEADLAKLGAGIKAAPLGVQERVREAYGIRLGELRAANAAPAAAPAPAPKTYQKSKSNRRVVVKRGEPAYVN